MKSTLKLIKNAEIYSPKYLGKKDILIGGREILAIGDNLKIDSSVEHETVDFKGDYLIPGLIDNHVHIIGGGGEGGFKLRTPEIMLSDITLAGVTTVIGVLGTDGTTRTMTNLLAKARGLEEEGITTFIQTGSYEIPVRTITGSIVDDIILIDKVIGVGEVALSDHRSTCPTFEELAKVISQARLGGMLSGKAGVVNVHMGDGTDMLSLIYEVLDRTSIPIRQIVPTHMNRNPQLFSEAIKYANIGGFVDFTTSTTEVFLAEGETKCSKAMEIFYRKGILDRVTLSSDGQGSLPEFDGDGHMTGVGVGEVKSIFKEIRDSIVEEKIPLEDAITVATKNTAEHFKLDRKGEIKVGNDADLLRLDENYNIVDVYAMGNTLVKDKAPVVKGTYEK
ncbi:beta-aspartyl-dipeptidase (metallo-type) [Anaerosphaera aminiphila DSM 21120]|uniref:Isoaspartyl dipeptidase n=1 Tax=Anaerosphaera aminiphila DSM 21120 TaxID=1120995 RepID=A0A1M5PU27_9FIRM|nr:beta-aspartyl-peptidase [Anaerosphaera aminiphila]SHH05076.1 beta-aspartyl-dipeptidase (metallo-type) [Anaerosphaera aminiphila DSM 21120]